MNIFTAGRTSTFAAMPTESAIVIRIYCRKQSIAVKVFEGAECIETSVVNVPVTWSLAKKKRAGSFLRAINEAKLAEEGKIEFKNADDLINEL